MEQSGRSEIPAAEAPEGQGAEENHSAGDPACCAEALDVGPGDLWMIAAHAWDVGGAAQVGYRTAFVARPGKAPYPLFPAPDVIGNNLREAAEGIIAAEDS